MRSAAISHYYLLIYLFNCLYNKFDFEFDDGDPVNYTKIKSNNFAFNVHASKPFQIFIVYSGLQYESSSMDFNYYFEDPNNYYPVEGKRFSI